MYFHSLADFLAMGGHGFYVWTAYGISTAVVTAHFVLLRRERKQTLRRIRRQLERDADPGENET